MDSYTSNHKKNMKIIKKEKTLQVHDFLVLAP
jgi:hypothetical protein